MRTTSDIVNDILNWRTSYDGQGLKDHLSIEIEKLQRKTAKSKSFRDEYIRRSGQLPPTISSKLADGVVLLEKLEYGGSLDEKDKSTLADMLEFIVVPFYHFSMSARQTLSSGPFIDYMADEMGDGIRNVAGRTRAKLEGNMHDYNRLAGLLIELCDNQHYPIAKNVRQFTQYQPESFRGM